MYLARPSIKGRYGPLQALEFAFRQINLTAKAMVSSARLETSRGEKLPWSFFKGITSDVQVLCR